MIFTTAGTSWTRVSLPRAISRGALAIYAVTGILAGATLLLETPALLSVVFSFLGYVAWPLMLLSYGLSLTPTWAAGAVEVTETSLVVRRGAKARAIPRSEIVSALIVDRPLAGGSISTVEIELRRGDRLTVRFLDPSASRALASELGFGPTGARATVSLSIPSRRLIHPLLGILAYVLGAIPVGIVAAVASYGGWGAIVAPAWPLFALAAYALLRRVTRGLRLTVGDDGVLVEGMRRRFYPRRDIAAVSGDDTLPIAIKDKGGSSTYLRGPFLDRARCAAVRQLIEARHRPAEAHADRLAEYDRRDANVAAWRERLRMTLEQRGYRAAASPVDEADAVVRSPLATPEQRIGAALALRIAGEPAERIRVAAEATVAEDVRAALEAVAEDDDARVEKALRRFR